LPPPIDACRRKRGECRGGRRCWPAFERGKRNLNHLVTVEIWGSGKWPKWGQRSRGAEEKNEGLPGFSLFSKGMQPKFGGTRNGFNMGKSCRGTKNYLKREGEIGGKRTLGGVHVKVRDFCETISNSVKLTKKNSKKWKKPG